MKKRQRRLMSLLLAAMLAAAPATQALAETAFEASAGVSGQILFQKDSLVNAAGAVMLDGEQVAEAGGSWTNTDENKVYTATSAEDGTIQLSEAGYMLVVEDGTASYADEEKDDDDNHYEFLDWEKPLEGETVKDIACYPAGEVVTLIANAPKDGMVFAYWTTQTEGVVIADPYNMETTITMPEKKVTVTAVYEAVMTEAQTEAVIDIPEETQAPTEAPIEAVTEAPIEIPTVYNVAVNNGEGGGSYEAGEWVSVSAYDRSEENLEFSGWYVDSMNATLDDTSSEFTGFVMPEADVTVTATYTEVQQAPTAYDLVVNNGSGSGSYEESEWVTVTANDRSEENLEFAGWYVDSMNVTLDDASAQSISFSMPAGSVTLTASYTEVPAETEAASYEAVVNNGSGSGTYEAGETVTVTAEDLSGEGSEFTGWFVESMNAVLSDTSAETASFVMPEESVIITATYADFEVEETDETEGTDETDLISDDPDAADETEQIDEDPGVVEEDPDSEEELTEAPEEAIVDEPDDDDPNETDEPDMEDVLATEPVTETPVEVETNQAEETDGSEDNETRYTLTVEYGFGGGEYKAQESVKVEADVPDGYRFKQWTTASEKIVISNSASSMLEFLMPEENVTLTAEFEKVYTVSLSADGLVSFADTTGTSASYAAGETVELTAKLENEAGQVLKEFAAYAEDGTQIDLAITEDAAQGTASFAMPEQNIVVKAVYEDKAVTYYTIKVSNGLINGTATEMYVPEGTRVEVTANEGPTGQYFAGWNINDGTFDMGEATYEETIWLEVTQDLTVLATYEGYQYLITVNSGRSDYDFGTAGTVVTIEADDAPDGMQFDYWYVDSQNVALANANSAKTTFTMPEDEVEVTAHYKQVEFAVYVENGTTSQQYYHAGDVVTVSSSYPASGRVFDKWVAVSGNVTFGDASRWQTTFTMPAADVTVKATYTDGPSAANNVIQEIIAGGEYLTGSTIRFTASGAGMDNTNPNPGDYRYRPSGYQIGNVTGTWQAAPYSTSMSIKAAGEYTLKVIFNKDVYDGTKWVSEGTSDAKSVTFYVVTDAAGVETGDDTPIAIVIAAAGVSCVLFIILLVVFLRRRSHRK